MGQDLDAPSISGQALGLRVTAQRIACSLVPQGVLLGEALEQKVELLGERAVNGQRRQRI